MVFKAMIHTLASKGRGFPVTSIGSLLDGSSLSVIYLKDSGFTTDFRSLMGKRIGHAGRFGKICRFHLFGGTGEADFLASRRNPPVKRATNDILASPAKSYELYIDIKPQMASSGSRKIDL